MTSEKTTTLRRSREDVVKAAARLFAERGYHGTSMRDLGRELGLLGSSLYSHVSSKEDLLVEVVEMGAALFEASAQAALQSADEPERQLQALISGHIDVVVDHLDEVRTFLNEANALHDRYRVVSRRDEYESVFREVLADGVERENFRSDLDPKMAGIFILSLLNATERWYRPDGPLDRFGLVEEMWSFVAEGIGLDQTT
ncbi:MAG: TetR family transcriptional regulator [Acidimicrobiia bacterium]|nr:TetR family transcriptional regulator [Acidimicrobiia bacterium]